MRSKVLKKFEKVQKSSPKVVKSSLQKDEEHRTLSGVRNSSPLSGALLRIDGRWSKSNEPDKEKETAEKQIQTNADDQEKDERNRRRREEADTMSGLSGGIRK